MAQIGTQQCVCASVGAPNTSRISFISSVFFCCFFVRGWEWFLVANENEIQHTNARTPQQTEWLTRDEENMFPNSRSVKRITQHTPYRVNLNIIRWKHFPFHRILILRQQKHGLMSPLRHTISIAHLIRISFKFRQHSFEFEKGELFIPNTISIASIWDTLLRQQNVSKSSWRMTMIHSMELTCQNGINRM